MTAPARAIAVVDTNVLLDVFSCHDLATTYNDAYRRLGLGALDDLAVLYRLARARESLLLGVHFNRIRATTYSLHFEPVELLTRRAPPAPGGQTLESDFTTIFIHFVKDYLLPNWNIAVPREPGTETKGTADRAYLAHAKQQSIPLLTNEGYGPSGVADEKLRARAKREGVPVFTPREFYQAKLDETTEGEAFLRRFRDLAPAYVTARRSEIGNDRIGDVLGWVHGFYSMILRGEVEGCATPAHVSLT